jgi:hypothetical protein
VPDIDILNPELPENPVSDWNAMHLPYCDGSLFAGDANVDEDGDGRPDRLQRGLANVSAALDVARETFPDPERVLFMGSSAGAIGAMLNMPLARHVWPDAELLVISDSGVGVARGELEPEFVASLMSEFNASSYLPPGCPDCIADGHLAPLVDWYLA